MKNLNTIRRKDANTFGAKAAMLGELMHHKINVPPGVVLTTEEIPNLALGNNLIVRSSAIGEDSRLHSWAGQLATYRSTNKGLAFAIKQCRSSLQSSQKYGNISRMAVIVQKYVKAKVSGVAFSRHPLTDRKVVVIEAVKGNSEKLTSGRITPEKYIGAAEGKLLSMHQAQEIVGIVQQIEKICKEPVDIEWAYGEKLYIVQCRPQTARKFSKKL